MKKVISLLMVFVALAVINPIPSQAQFQQPSPIVIYNPAAVTVTATCTTTGCPTFTLPPMCMATVRLTGVNTVISVIAQVSNDAGANYSPATPVIFSSANTGPNGATVPATGAMTQGGTGTPGLYVFQISTMNRIRFIVGTLTGTNVTIKIVASSACNGQAL
jgi:hypothetical protein